MRFIVGHSRRQNQPRIYPPKLCGCGCGEYTLPAARTNKKLGWIAGRPHAYIHGHRARTAFERILDPENGYFVIDESSGCWIWQRSLTAKGYGRLNHREARSGKAHRAIYEWVVGPLDPRIPLDHTCNNPPCVNPDHLEPVTNAENHRRAVGRRGERSIAEQLAAIVELRGRFSESAAGEYAVDPDTGCWVWLGSINATGYGRVYDRKSQSMLGAHRVLYQRETGEAVPRGWHIDHLCENKICVNPDHLEPVTPAENARRRWQRVRERNALARVAA